MKRKVRLYKPCLECGGATHMQQGGAFEPHMMYNPETGEGFMADTYEDHLAYGDQGYVHNDEMKKGGWIKGAIKNPGSFTKQAKAAGMTPAEYQKKVLANKDRYSAKTVRRANLRKTLVGMKKEGGSTALQNNGIDEIGANKLNMFTSFVSDNVADNIVNQETESMMDPNYFQFGGNMQDFGYGQDAETQMNMQNAIGAAQRNQQMQQQAGASLANFATTLGDVYDAQAAENERGAGEYDKWKQSQSNQMQMMDPRKTQDLEAAQSNRQLMPAVEMMYGGAPQYFFGGGAGMGGMGGGAMNNFFAGAVEKGKKKGGLGMLKTALTGMEYGGDIYEQYGGMVDPSEFAYMAYGGNLPMAQDGNMGETDEDEGWFNDDFRVNVPVLGTIANWAGYEDPEIGVDVPFINPAKHYRDFKQDVKQGAAGLFEAMGAKKLPAGTPNEGETASAYLARTGQGEIPATGRGAMVWNGSDWVEPSTGSSTESYDPSKDVCAPGEKCFSEDNPNVSGKLTDKEVWDSDKDNVQETWGTFEEYQRNADCYRKTGKNCPDSKTKDVATQIEETINVPKSTETEDTEDTTTEDKEETKTTTTTTQTQPGLPYGIDIKKIKYGRGFLGLGKERLRKLKFDVYTNPGAYSVTWKAAKEGNPMAKQVLSSIKRDKQRAQDSQSWMRYAPDNYATDAEVVDEQIAPWMRFTDQNTEEAPMAFEDRSGAGQFIRRPRQALFGDREERQARRAERREDRQEKRATRKRSKLPGQPYGMYGGVFKQGGPNPLQFAPDNYGDQGGGGQGDLLGTATVKEKKMDFQKSGPGAAGWAEIGLAGAKALASTVDFLKNKEDDIGSMTSADKVFASKKQDPRQLGMDYTFNPMGIASNPVLAEQASKFGNAYNTAMYGGHFQNGGNINIDDEIYMSDAEVAQFMAMGGQIEYVD